MLGLAAAVTGAAAGAAALGGTVAAAPRRAAANPVVISARPDLGPVGYPNAALKELVDTAMAPLLTANPGLQVNLFAASDGAAWQGWQGGLQASMLAGLGPDVFGDWILTGYASAGLLYDLEPYVRKDNLDLSVYWNAMIQYNREIGRLAPKPFALGALPSLTLALCMVVNLGVLDQLGLKYPEPGWTHVDWTKMWEATAIKPSGKKVGRAGVAMNYYSDLWAGYNHSYTGPGDWILHGFGGGYADPQDFTRSYLDSPGSIAAGEWAWGVRWSGIGAGNDYNYSFTQGQLVSSDIGTQSLVGAAEGYRGVKWDFFDPPVWPVNPTGYSSTDSLAMWAGTKHPDAAWQVLKWISYGKIWQRMQMRVSLMSPSRADMAAEWTRTVQEVAPPLRSKNWDVWLRQFAPDRPYLGHLFPYATGTVESVLGGPLFSALNSRKTTVAAAFRQMAKQIDAAESAGRASSVQSAREMAAYTAGMAQALAAPASHQFPAPSRTGIGRPPVQDAKQVSVKGGAYTVEGGGAGITYSPGNGLTFACAASTATRDTFTCRVTSIQAIKPDTLQDGARFGLMARSDLSDTCAELGIEVSANRGVHTHTQINPSVSVSSGQGDQRPADHGQLQDAAGLLPSSQIWVSSSTAKNFLTRPVWLRLVRNVNEWTAYTSLDGTTWTQAGTPIAGEILGAWIGLYVTAKNNGSLARATFDHVSGFTPTTFVRLGAP